MAAPGTISFFGIRQIFAVTARLIIDTGNVENTAAPAQKAGLVAQNTDAILRGFPGFITLTVDKSLVITKTAEDTRIGPKTSEFPNGAVQRIAWLRDDIAGDHGQMRLQFIQHVDGAGRIANTQPGTDVKIAQLADPEPDEVGMKVRNRQIDLFDVKIDPLDDAAPNAAATMGA